MKTFWQGFEKKAVSVNWLQKLYLSGLARRAGENTKGDFTKKMIELGGKGPDVQWRKSRYGSLLSPKSPADKLEEVRQINKKTKKDPGAAAEEWQKELSDMLG